MHIRGFHIDGFGVFHDQGLHDLPAGLVLFVGDNESGKTTLMEFIRTVLFGPRRRKVNTNTFPPLRGGRPGGRLELATAAGQMVTVDRHEKKVTLTEADGAVEQAEPADRLFPGIDRQTFERVFAVGLDELQGLAVLSEEGLRGRLLSAGTGLGAASVPRTLKAIDRGLDDLLKIRSKKPEVNKLLHQIDEADKDLLALREQAAEYGRCQRERAALERRVAEDKGRIAGARSRLAHIDRLVRAREPWAGRNANREKAAEFEEARTFPPDGLVRIESLKKECEQLAADREKKEDSAKRLQEELSQVTVDEAVLAQREAIGRLVGEREKLAQAVADLPDVKARLDSAEEELAKRLGELGADWTVEHLAAVDTSVQVRQQVQNFAQSIEAAARAHDDAEARRRTLADHESELERASADAKEQLDALSEPEEKDLSRLRKHQQALGMVRTLMHHRDVVQTRLDAARSALEDARSRRAALERQVALGGVGQLPWWASAAVALVGLVLAAVTAFSSVPTALVLAAGTLALAAALHLLRRRQLAASAARVDQLHEDRRQGEEQCRTLGAEADRLEEELNRIGTQMGRASQDAGIRLPKDDAALEQQAVECARAIDAVQTWTARAQQADAAAKAHRRARQQLDEAAEETRQTAEQLAQLTAEWRRWLADRGFSASDRPDQFEVVLGAVEAARSAETARRQQRERAAKLDKYQHEARARIREVLERLQPKSAADEPGVEELDSLARALSQAQEARKERQRIQSLLDATRADARQLRQAGEKKKAEWDRLMHNADAADEEEFRRRAEAHRQFQQYTSAADENEIALGSIAGTPEAKQAIEEELARVDPAELVEERNRLEEQLVGLEQAVSDAEREVGSLTRQLDQMANDRRLGEVLLVRSGLESDLAAAVRRWAVLAVCRSLLERAREVYESQRQPQVIQEASSLLATMTGGRYRLMASLSAETIQLEDRRMRRKEEPFWSSGLADQTYLAIRLALAQEFGRHAEPLPVILDDVLVRFDPGRRLRAAQMVLQFAAGRQVLLFSCHPDLVELIGEARREASLGEVPAAVYEIADGVIRPHPAWGS